MLLILFLCWCSWGGGVLPGMWWSCRGCGGVAGAVVVLLGQWTCCRGCDSVAGVVVVLLGAVGVSRAVMLRDVIIPFFSSSLVFPGTDRRHGDCSKVTQTPQRRTCCGNIHLGPETDATAALSAYLSKLGAASPSSPELRQYRKIRPRETTRHNRHNLVPRNERSQR